uniref:BTB domain-containing protein n=1 Tax=Plectus sambesii TaxID=2011161 RepID=A0A914XN82_9BILA
MDTLRKEGILCDCVLVATDGSEVAAHRSVLAAASPYFRALFVHRTDSHTPSVSSSGDGDGGGHRTVESSCSRCQCRIIDDAGRSTSSRVTVITGVPAEQVAQLVDFAYTGKLRIRDFWEAEQLVPVAGQWLMTSLVDECCQFLVDHVSVENCIGVWLFVEHHGCQSTADAMRDFVLYHMRQLAIDGRSVEWFRLDARRVRELLADDRINVSGELDVWMMVRGWVAADREVRQPQLPALLETVRFGNEQPSDLLNVVQRDSLISPSLQELLAQVAIKPNRLRMPRDLLFAVGGWSNGAPTQCMEVYDWQANSWFLLPDNGDNNPRAYHAMAVVGHKILIVGGYDGSEYYNSVRCWDSHTGLWSEAAPMYSARCYVCAATLDGLVYACGGFDGQSRLATAEKYDPKRNQWTLIHSMNRSRSDAAASAYQGRLYVAGGFNGETVLASVEMYIPESDLWIEVAEMSSPRSGLGLIAYKDHPIAPMRIPRSNFAVAVLVGKVYAIGGYDGAQTTESVELYDAARDCWTVASRMNLSRSAVKACTIADCPNVARYCYRTSQ